jgi:hypothetical protein
MASGSFETKFDINDMVYFKIDGGLFKGCISEIYLNVSKYGILVSYEIGIPGKGSWKVHSSSVYKNAEDAFTK